MTFYDIICQVSAKEIHKTLVSMCNKTDTDWPLDKYVEYHLLAYFQLLEMEPTKTDMIIDVLWFDATEDDIEIYGDTAQEECAGYSVSGYDPNDSFDDFSYLGKSEPGVKNHFAIEFCDWHEWLGMKLSITSLMLPYAVIIGECLWEMTFMGNTVETVREESKCLLDKCRECMAKFNSEECEFLPIDNLD